eukprot:NODE_499_length_784_cov_348.512938_g490_i0.p1 GENE.NODE_499_length_784_cov_348.512938_g490_i0~~NODE_499_length_784_cov_348.512938_g490_i0.p1  ORF type:complete len:229 (-),score=44.06 NODE_499_length_784_cov_348.512938_g490_i0:96-695(-)
MIGAFAFLCLVVSVTCESCSWNVNFVNDGKCCEHANTQNQGEEFLTMVFERLTAVNIVDNTESDPVLAMFRSFWTPDVELTFGSIKRREGSPSWIGLHKGTEAAAIAMDGMRAYYATVASSFRISVKDSAWNSKTNSGFAFYIIDILGYPKQAGGTPLPTQGEVIIYMKRTPEGKISHWDLRFDTVGMLSLLDEFGRAP